MKNRAPIFALIALLALHQIMAGAFVGGTVMCIGCNNSNGFNLLPTDLATCTSKNSALAQDTCCNKETVITDADGDLLATEKVDQRCTGYALTNVLSILSIDRPAVDIVFASVTHIGMAPWFGQNYCEPKRDSSLLRLSNQPMLQCLATVIILC